MSKFKAGDKVRKVNDEYLWKFELGDELVVVGISILGNPEVKKEGDDRRATAYDTDLELITPHPEPDPVNHPSHYTTHPSGIECIQITESMGFCLGNAVKYIWRADLKNDAIEDLQKAVWYINREIDRRVGVSGGEDK